MLLHWYRPATIALAGDGIAILSPGSPPRLLCEAKNCYASSQEMLKALSNIANNIEAMRVRFVISNHYVRYGVLPWRDGIVSREDWLALAKHDFRRRYGPVAENWDVRVSFNGFGKNVVSCAIDQSLIEKLNHLALAQHWQIVSIEPLLMVVNKLAQAKMKANWMLIAESERVLLCESLNQEWQKFSVISSPKGQEQELSLQQIVRSLLKVSPSSKPDQVVTCIAPQLGENWRCDEVSLRPLPTNRQSGTKSSALWMVGL